MMRAFLKFTILLKLTTFSVFGKDKCEIFFPKLEGEYSLPKHSLLAVALTESGKLDKRVFRSWPWTIGVKGKSYYYKSKKDAVKAAKRFIGQGHRNLDFGCMQISYMYHGKKFHSIDDMFEPKINTAYAAKFLSELIQKKGSWRRAIGFYNSSNPRFYIPYRNKVLAFYKRAKVGEFSYVYENGLASDAPWEEKPEKLDFSAPKPLEKNQEEGLIVLLENDFSEEGGFNSLKGMGQEYMATQEKEPVEPLALTLRRQQKYQRQQQLNSKSIDEARQKFLAVARLKVLP